MEFISERINALFGPTLLFITSSATEGRVVPTRGQCLQECFGLIGVRVLLTAMNKGRDPGGHRILVGMPLQLETILGAKRISKLNHLSEFIRRVDMKEREWDLTGSKGFLSQTDHDR